ncbi:hypothetical protein ACSZND_22455 [Aeromonas hydrophila]|uniref:hypothetical protein n=1 Tax=Aeromonas TaxID=642 RepID=UPI00111AF5C7|nr:MULTISPECIES: hypothetical protein [Aeromonas]MCX4103533.1 hypothetical protein [Aeromonas hydrophila]
MSDNSDSDMEQLYRKRLMILATCILIYVIAGGALVGVGAGGAEIQLLGAKLVFYRPKWLEYAAIIVMVYLWLRHKQFSSHEREKLTKQVYGGLRISKRISDRLFEMSPDPFVAWMAYQGSFHKVRYSSQFECHLEEEHDEYSYPISVMISSPRGIVVCIDSYNVYSKKANSWRVSNLIGFKEFFDFYLAYARSYMICAFKYPEFCHAKLPSYLTWISIFIYFLNQFYFAGQISK